MTVSPIWGGWLWLYFVNSLGDWMSKKMSLSSGSHFELSLKKVILKIWFILHNRLRKMFLHIHYLFAKNKHVTLYQRFQSDFDHAWSYNLSVICPIIGHMLMQCKPGSNSGKCLHSRNAFYTTSQSNPKQTSHHDKHVILIVKNKKATAALASSRCDSIRMPVKANVR